MSEEKEPNFVLELGQVIQLISPLNTYLHKKTLLIDYLDNNLIKLVNEEINTEIKIIDNKFTDETIETIHVLANPKESGYAKQNNLVINKWISIRFGGKIPTIINGKITDLEEDQIQITTYPEKKIIYIDFEYKGIPLHLPIESITEIESPILKTNIEGEKSIEDPTKSEDIEDIEDLDLLEEDLELLIDTEIVKENINNIFIDIDDIILDTEENLGIISEEIQVSEDQKRFGIDNQTNDLLDELLSSYPSSERTKKVIDKIHVSIERFKQLRKSFSKFDEYGNAESIIRKGAQYKPLIKKLELLNQKLYWLIPIVKNKHKLYDSSLDEEDILADVIQTTLASSRVAEAEIFEQYKKNTIPDGQNKYLYLFERLNYYLTPFAQTDDNNNIVSMQKIQENLDVIVDNLGDFYSNMVSNVSNDIIIKNQQFVIDRYNLGLNKLESKDNTARKKTYKLTNLTNDESISLKGFISLKEPYIQYSHINLPNTSLLKKVNLHQFNFNLSEILSNDTEIEKINIEENKEFSNEIFNENYLKKLTAYTFEEDRKYTDRKNDSYGDFLNNMIPKTKFLFQLIKKNIKNGTSFIKVIEYLEPFMIYTDDISYKQYTTINRFIREEIEKHKTKLTKNIALYNKYKLQNVSYNIPSILPKLINPEILKIINIFDESLYDINPEIINTTDSIKKILSMDNGDLFFTTLTLSEISLLQPVDIEKTIEDELSKLNEEKKDKEEDNSCKFVLAKKYIDLDELDNDNNQETIFFDKQYDNTRYDIGNAWIEKQMEDDPESLQIMLTEFLIKNNGLSKEKAEYDAASMMLGNKQVKEGDYALLDLGDLDYKYFVRKGKVWRLDKELSNKNIDEVTFCNIKAKCLNINKECTDINESKNIIKNNMLNTISKHFQDTLKISFETLKRDLNNKLEIQEKKLKKIKEYNYYNNIKKDTAAMKIAETLDIKEIVVSPYSEIRDAVLSQTDITKKFNDIILFIENFCRENNPLNKDESIYWYYCKDTHTKLLPTFYSTLANGFFSNEFILYKEKICSERGQISDDGDKWIDKHSGYYIASIEYDTSEGYDKAGYKIKSRDTIQKDTTIVFKDVTFNFKTDLANQIQKHIMSLDEYLFLDMKSYYPFIIKITTDCINKYLKDEKTYTALVQRAKKRGKKKKPYEKAFDEILVFSMISAYIIAVQTAIPSVNSNKTYPTCSKSFSGFPLDGTTDYSFLDYIVCILFNFRTEERPWRIVPRKKNSTNKEKFLEKLKKFIKEKIIIFDYIEEKLDEKREFNNKLKYENTIFDDFNIQLWDTFYPPLENVTVLQTSNISANFKKLLKDTVNSGDFQQFSFLYALNAKIQSFSLLINEEVQSVINSQPLVLNTMAGIPFLENACCNEDLTNSYKFFVTKNDSIRKYNDVVNNLTHMQNKYNRLKKSTILNIKKNTKIVFPNIDKDFSTSTIYLAFIKYCKYNTGILLDEEVSRICLNNTSSFLQTDSLEEKIEKMKNEGLNFSQESLKQLLNIINKQNILSYDIDPSIITEKLYLEKTLEYLNNKDSLHFCSKKVIEKLIDIIDTFDVLLEEKEKDPNITNLFTITDNLNNTFLEKLQEKMTEYGKFNKNVMDLLFNKEAGNIGNKTSQIRKNKFILNWDSQFGHIYYNEEDHTGLLIFNTLKQFVTDICQVYPNMIINKVDNSKRLVPKHWKLSERHISNVQTIIAKEHKSLIKFYGHKELKPILEYVLEKSEDLLMLMNSIPFYSGLVESKSKSIFNGTILKKLGYHFLISALDIYISATNVKISGIQQEQFDDELLDEKQEEGVNFDILQGKMETTNQSILSLVEEYLKILQQKKKLLNITNKKINKNVLKSKEKEKSKITRHLKDLTIEEREIENVMKNYSLGDWSVGQTRAIFEYDENQYDKELKEIEQSALLEARLGTKSEVTDFNREIYELSMQTDALIQQRIDAEVYSLAHIADDDDFGDRDGDEGF